MSVVHPVVSLPEEPAMGDLLLDTLIRFSRENSPIRGLSFRTKDYLWLAFMCGINEPGAEERPLPPRFSGAGCCGGSFVPALQARPPRCVRVGKSFQIHGPHGPVLIEEE